MLLSLGTQVLIFPRYYRTFLPQGLAITSPSKQLHVLSLSSLKSLFLLSLACPPALLCYLSSLDNLILLLSDPSPREYRFLSILASPENSCQLHQSFTLFIE